MKLKAKDRNTAYELLCHKVWKKDGIPPEKITPETTVQGMAFNSFISRREIQERKKTLPATVSTTLQPGLTVIQIVNVLWPDQSSVKVKKKKKRSKH